MPFSFTMMFYVIYTTMCYIKMAKTELAIGKLIAFALEVIFSGRVQLNLNLVPPLVFLLFSTLGPGRDIPPA